MSQSVSPPSHDAAGFAQSVMARTIELMRDLANGHRGDFEELKHRAQVLLEAHEEIAERFDRERGQLREKARAVDAWILDIFGATEQAIPRETLVADFIERYREQRDIKDSDKHPGPWLFEFETEHAQGRLVAVHPVACAGIHSDAFLAICAEYLPRSSEDPFLAPLLFDEHEIDGWHALWFGGSPLFDRLLNIRRRFGGEPDYWVNAVLLPGDGRYESRALFLLHPNVGDLYQPEPPAAMRQDQRLLLVLVLAWRQLEHQIKSLAALSEADRRELIQLIAPGLMHHEIGTVMRTLHAQAYEQFQLLMALAQQAGVGEGHPLARAVRYAHSIGNLAKRLHSITDAFNNLDKRAEVEETTLGHIFGELRLLLTHRLGALGVDMLLLEEEFAGIGLRSDAVLLEQALLNILNNALNALDEGGTPAPRRLRIYLERQDSRSLTLALVNNGPPIPADLSKDIFRRGYTSRAHGHGQGLYLARLIAHYLGGEVFLMETNALPEGYRAGFRFSLLRQLQAREGVSRASE